MARKESRNAEPPQIDQRRIWHSMFWLVLSGAWVMSGASLLSYDAADWPGRFIAPHNNPPANWIGRAGAWIAHELYSMIGPGVWILMAGVLAFLVITARRKTVTQPVLRTTGLVLMGLATSSLIDLCMRGTGESSIGAGGLVANFVVSELVIRFSILGTVVILLVGFWVGAVLAMDQVLSGVGRVFLLGTSKVLGWCVLPRGLFVGRRMRFGLIGVNSDTAVLKSKVPLRCGGKTHRGPSLAGGEQSTREEEAAIGPEAGGLGATESFGDESEQSRRTFEPARETDELDSEIEEGEEEVEESDAEQEEQEQANADAPGAYVSDKKRFNAEELRAKIKKLSINFAPAHKPQAPPPREVDLSGYRFPDISLLEEPESDFTADVEHLVRDQAVKLESALQQYRIEGEVVGIDSGPVITLYEVRLAPGTKVAQLNNISSDIARALKAHNVRIVPNMTGKDTVGIEVPNLKKERVRLKELMTTHSDTVKQMTLPMWLGKDASGNPLIADLGAMPHMLIAGTTGSGKSVCMNSIIMSFLFTRRPDELKLVLVDPKMVEMSVFRDIPHLMCPVVTEMPKAAAILEWATTKMDERYELLAEAGVRDVASYNNLTTEELIERFEATGEAEEAAIPKKLPLIVFMVDELADLMMTAKEVEGYIVRLAQKARAVGLHLILATQRPQANVVTGLIKSNMPCRVSFKVASGMDSRIVLDHKGAELLLGQGDMLYLSPQTSKITRAQGTLIEDAEIRRTVEFLRNVAEPNFEPQLIQLKSPDLNAGEAERDPLFDDAVTIVLESKRGSVSLLQRRLTIGYSRASRLIEQMAVTGILGEYKGSQAREVVMSLDEWEALKAQAEADAGHAPDAESAEELDDDGDGTNEDDQFEPDPVVNQDGVDEYEIEGEDETGEEAEQEEEEEQEQEEKEEENEDVEIEERS